MDINTLQDPLRNYMYKWVIKDYEKNWAGKDINIGMMYAYKSKNASVSSLIADRIKNLSIGEIHP